MQRAPRARNLGAADCDRLAVFATPSTATVSSCVVTDPRERRGLKLSTGRSAQRAGSKLQARTQLLRRRKFDAPTSHARSTSITHHVVSPPWPNSMDQSVRRHELLAFDSLNIIYYDGHSKQHLQTLAKYPLAAAI